MNWSSLIMIYVVLRLLIFFSIFMVEDKVPENTKFKKWWRKHIFSNDIED
jgi:L-asparagine transporter-like permease